MRIETVSEPDAGPYRAGACNIGPAEIRRRLWFGVLAAVVTVVLGVVLVATGSPAWMRLLLFFAAAKLLVLSAVVGAVVTIAFTLLPV